MPELIDENQHTFIKGRTIEENIVLYQEIFQNYHRKWSKPNLGMKIDLYKPYD